MVRDGCAVAEAQLRPGLGVLYCDVESLNEIVQKGKERIYITIEGVPIRTVFLGKELRRNREVSGHALG